MLKSQVAGLLGFGHAQGSLLQLQPKEVPQPTGLQAYHVPS